MNSYNDSVFYNYPPMPYNGFYPRPEHEGGTHADDGGRRKKNQNMAAILAALEYYDDSS
jgi:hypothetical protein